MPCLVTDHQQTVTVSYFAGWYANATHGPRHGSRLMGRPPPGAVDRGQLRREFSGGRGCGRRGPYDKTVMEQVGTDDEELLDSWRQGRVRDLYMAVRAPMRQAASQGIASITASRPDPHDVEDAVYDAFTELELRNPASVVSVVGLAKKIAYRRGQDTGRKIIRRREKMHKLGSP
jgi:hypothetical protein